MQNSNGKECFHRKEKVADKQIKYGSEEKNRKQYHLECCTVCSRDMDGNLEEEVISFESWIWRRMLKISWTEKTQIQKFGKDTNLLCSRSLNKKKKNSYVTMNCFTSIIQVPGMSHEHTGTNYVTLIAPLASYSYQVFL